MCGALESYFSIYNDMYIFIRVGSWLPFNIIAAEKKIYQHSSNIHTIIRQMPLLLDRFTRMANSSEYIHLYRCINLHVCPRPQPIDWTAHLNRIPIYSRSFSLHFINILLYFISHFIRFANCCASLHNLKACTAIHFGRAHTFVSK